MKYGLYACLFLLLPACASEPLADPVHDRYKNDPADQVLFESLKRQGLIDWYDCGGLRMSLRTRETGESGVTTTVEELSLDLAQPRIHLRGNQGAAFIEKAFSNGVYWETRDRELLRDPEKLAENRYRLLNFYFITTLPFFLDKIPAVFEMAEPVTMNGTRYDVVEFKPDASSPIPPEPIYLLYFSHATQLLEKVRYVAGTGTLAGKTIWCALDNFADYDGVFLPLHHVYTYQEDEGKEHRIREEWLFDLEFTGAPDEVLFIEPVA
ncbi:MAG: hypothetical protein KJ645_07765 [Planctomycetes bacterium]|nr:hypothetical protein [Planctomycetota bacterium]